jgi:hypothetical protein
VSCICVMYLCHVSVSCICVMYLCLCHVSVSCICVMYLCHVSVSCICGVSILPLSTIFLYDFETNVEFVCFSIYYDSISNCTLNLMEPKSLFVLLYSFFWPLCLFFFDIWILIVPLISSNSSYFVYKCKWVNVLFISALPKKIRQKYGKWLIVDCCLTPTILIVV